MIDNIVKLLTNYWLNFLEGTGYTLLMSLITVFFGLIFGSLLALFRRAGLKALRFIATAYIEVIRGTPVLLQLYFFYFLLPDLIPIGLTKFQCVMVALIVNSSAYTAEIIRSGIQAVDSGQMEAARSLGLDSRRSMIWVVLPQAVKNILPALCNEFIMVIKETSLASTFFIGELMTQFRELSGALYLAIEPLIIIGAVYFVLTFTLSKGVAAIERRLAQSD